MSESLRDLVVSLSLNSDNFTRNIKSVNAQIKEAESFFKAAGAGVDKFDASTAGLTSRMTMLERKLALQKDAVDQYERALVKASAKLAECQSRQVDYANRLTTAKQRQSALKDAVDRASAAYDRYKTTLGENDSVTVNAGRALESLKAKYSGAKDEVTRLAGQTDALQKASQNAADVFSNTNTKLHNAQAAYKSTAAEIEKTKNALALAQTQWDTAGQTIVRSEQAVVSIGKSMRVAESRFRLAGAGIKGFDTSAEGLSARLTLLGDKLTLQKQAVTEYKQALTAAKTQLTAAQQANDPERVRQATDAVKDARTALNNARAAVKQTKADIADTNKELDTARSRWTAAGQALSDFGERSTEVGKKLTKAGKTLSLYMTTPIVALGKKAIKASMDYESAFTSVRKTVNATEEEFEGLSEAVKDMSTKLATSATDIAEVMSIAGQMGIENGFLDDFTETIVKLGMSTDIVAADAAMSLAKFANITAMEQSEFKNLGAALVDLGNNYATTESAILEMSMRLAGAGHQVGLSESQILGFATALSSVGIEAQMGGSAFSKSLVKMEVASATGGKALDDFAMVCGMTAEQFKLLWDNDPAAAFQAFIVGLSKMDDEGESAIATLQEIGIAEVRLRDTLLRATNATDLFSRAQQTANAAWQQNSALNEEAGKRLQTTASRLANLKNTAVLFAQKIGNDLNPTIQNLIDGANGMLEKFMALDEAQRMQIIKYAAIAAAAGPVLLTLGKITRGIGAVSTTISKFALAVGKAGGGFKGFMTVLGKSPAVWMAVGAAVIYGANTLYDYASGAKAARDAIDGMNDAARNMRNSDLKTIYESGTSDPLGRFRISQDELKAATEETGEWLDTLATEWADARVETKETIAAYVNGFTAASDDVRNAIARRREALGDMGLLDESSNAAMQADLDQLTAWDKEIEALLTRKKNTFLSSKDKKRLDEIIQLRAELRIEYVTTDTEAYARILSGIENEKARAAAVSETVGIDLFSDALVAATELRKNYLDTLNAEYDARRDSIALMTDEGERIKAQAELDEWYAANRQSQADDYSDTLAKVGKETFDNSGIQASIADLSELYEHVYAFDGKTESLEELQAWLNNLDGSGLASVVTFMSQLADAGLHESDLGFKPTAYLAMWQGISDIASAYPEQLKGLNEIVNEIIPEEAQEILVSLNLENATKQWEAFVDGADKFTVELEPPPTTDVTVHGDVRLNPLNQSQAALWRVNPNNWVKLTGVINEPVGLTFGEDWKSKLEALWAQEKLKMYGEDGLPIDVKPEVIQALDKDALVMGKDEDGTYHVTVSPNPDPVIVYGDVELNPLDKARVAIWRALYGKVKMTGEITAPVDIYFGDDWDSNLEKLWQQKKLALYDANGLPIEVNPNVVKALDKSALVTGMDEDGTYHIIVKPEWEGAGVKEVEAAIDGLKDDSGVDNGLFGTSFLGTAPLDAVDMANMYYKMYSGMALRSLWPKTGLFAPDELKSADDIISPEMAKQIADTTATIASAANNGTTLSTDTVDFVNSLADVIDNISKYGKNEDLVSGILTNLSELGIQLNATELSGYLRGIADTATATQTAISAACAEAASYVEIAKNATDNGTILQYTAAAKAVLAYAEALQSGVPIETAQEIINSTRDTSVALAGLYAAIDAVNGEHIEVEDLSGDVKQLDEYCEAYERAVQALIDDSQTDMPQETIDAFRQMLADAPFKSAADLFKNSGLDLGTDTGAGIGEALAKYNFSTDAEASAASMENALRTAYDSHSPARLTMPIGNDAAAGIGVGMSGYSFANDAAATASQLRSALTTALPGASLYAVGVNSMLGLRNGIIAGRSGVIDAMRDAANAAVVAAKETLQIHSPSGVFEDEVGRMMMKGLGKGVLLESKEQARTLSNAARYLTGAAQYGVGAGAINDNRKSYSDTNAVNVSGNTFYVRDHQDVQSLAIEIAGLLKRQQHGMGLRMA